MKLIPAIMFLFLSLTSLSLHAFIFTYEGSNYVVNFKNLAAIKIDPTYKKITDCFVEKNNALYTINFYTGEPYPVDKKFNNPKGCFVTSGGTLYIVNPISGIASRVTDKYTDYDKTSYHNENGTHAVSVRNGRENTISRKQIEFQKMITTGYLDEQNNIIMVDPFTGKVQEIEKGADEIKKGLIYKSGIPYLINTQDLTLIKVEQLIK